MMPKTKALIYELSLKFRKYCFQQCFREPRAAGLFPCLSNFPGQLPKTGNRIVQFVQY